MAVECPLEVFNEFPIGPDTTFLLSMMGKTSAEEARILGFLKTRRFGGGDEGAGAGATAGAGAGAASGGSSPPAGNGSFIVFELATAKV